MHKGGPGTRVVAGDGSGRLVVVTLELVATRKPITPQACGAPGGGGSPCGGPAGTRESCCCWNRGVLLEQRSPAAGEYPDTVLLVLSGAQMWLS